MSMDKRTKALESMSKIFNEILIEHARKTKKAAEETKEMPESSKEDISEDNSEKKEKYDVKAPSWIQEKKAVYAKPAKE